MEEIKKLTLSLPTVVPVVTIRDVVMFPGMSLPLSVDRERSINAVECALRVPDPEELEDKFNSMPCVVESIVVDREGKLVALVFPDTSADGKKLLGSKTIPEMMEENRVAVNKNLPAYSQISAVELVAQEFEKTPKRSIKRYLYK